MIYNTHISNQLISYSIRSAKGHLKLSKAILQTICFTCWSIVMFRVLKAYFHLSPRQPFFHSTQKLIAQSNTSHIYQHNFCSNIHIKWLVEERLKIHRKYFFEFFWWFFPSFVTMTSYPIKVIFMWDNHCPHVDAHRSTCGQTCKLFKYEIYFETHRRSFAPCLIFWSHSENSTPFSKGISIYGQNVHIWHGLIDLSKKWYFNFMLFGPKQNQ